MGIGSWLVVIAIATAACGKKGPPLAPLVPIPAAIEQIAATRLGSDVYVTVTLPAANVDAFEPADLGRVEIYGYTGRSAPPRARWVEFATLVGSIPVAPAPLKPGETPPPDVTEPPPDAPKQGSTVTLMDSLTPDELVQGREAAAVRGPQTDRRTPPPTLPAENAVRTPPQPLKRFYIAVPFSRRGRPGPPGGVAEFPLLPVPDASPAVRAQYTPGAIQLSWEPAGGLIGFLLERSLPEELLPFVEDEPVETVDAPDLSGPLAYHVYRELVPDPSTPPGPREASWNAQPLTPITAVPVAGLGLTDTLEFGRHRCYAVRGVRGAGPAARVGKASPEACFTPVDTFPPAAPHSIVAVATEGAISLMWEPNTEVDLGGYIVLRGEAPGDTLLPLTAGPIVETGYRDATVTPGTRYVYAVVAVDNRLPVPNMSLASGTVEETAR